MDGRYGELISLEGEFMYLFSNLNKSWRKTAFSNVFRAAFVASIVASCVFAVSAQAITEGFDDITTLPGNGWFTKNNSSPVGTTNWFQGNATVFPSQGGATTAYIGANFNNTAGTGTISNWLLTPVRTLSNGDVMKFWTRGVDGDPFPDRMQVRMSLAGSSTDVGTSATSVGVFTTLLLDIDPTYSGTYPDIWTEYTITVSGLSGPTSGRFAFRYFVENGGPTGDNSNYIGIDTFSYTPNAAPANVQHVLDFNGDGKTDWTVVRNTGGGANGQVTWFYNLNGTATTEAKYWGLASDSFVSGDFDGDGKSDLAVWRSGAPTVAAFYVLNSTDFTARVEAFGQTGDDPTVVGDYNGDGKTDLAVYRDGANAGDASTWFYRTTPGGPVTYQIWGMNGDFPAPGDYDGDGRADFVVQRNNGGGQARFWGLFTKGVATEVFGTPTDTIVPGDYDGDGKTDLATVRGVGGALQWQYLSSQSGTIFYNTFGSTATDYPVQGDYNGDGKTDIAIWRPSATPGASAFWVLNSGGSVSGQPFGASGDYPVATYNSH